MAIIANMKKQENGTFEGKLKVATLNLQLILKEIEGHDGDNTKPKYRAKLAGFEAGAGWLKTSEQDNEYVSVQLDSPEFPNPIYANLIEKDGKHILIWSRQN
jgi:uncharacterized protein (DUF736 family)